MLVTKWILVGAFLATNPTSGEDYTYIRSIPNSFDSPGECQQAKDMMATPQLEALKLEGHFKVFTLDCVKVEMKLPEVPKSEEAPKK